MPDIDAIRRSFTSLSRTGADGRPLVFLDGPGGAQVPDVVIDAMAGYLRHSNANIDGAFVTSEETTAARRKGASLRIAAPRGGYWEGITRPVWIRLTRRA